MPSLRSREMMSRDAVDDAISEYGWRAVQEGLHRLGRPPTPEELEAASQKHRRESSCDHTWFSGSTSLTDPDGDFCVACGRMRRDAP